MLFKAVRGKQLATCLIRHTPKQLVRLLLSLLLAYAGIQPIVL